MKKNEKRPRGQIKYRLCKSKGLLFGGTSNNGANAGSFNVNTNNAPSNTNANIGSHLCLENIIKLLQTLPLGKKIQVKKEALVSKENEILSKKQSMKRIGNLYSKIYALDNLRLADEKARKGKRHTYGVQLHDKSREANLLALSKMLKNKTYKTSEYDVFKIYEPKERLVYRLPYFPDRIAHHAIMNILEPIWVSIFTRDTYSCIKNRGIHACQKQIQSDLRNNPDKTKYCLKLDITKFYPSVDHGIMKAIVARKIKDKDLLWLISEIIDSAEGLPIGNYLSQYLANLYLAYFDHWIKEEKQVAYYYRYADDIVVLSSSKEELWELFGDIEKYLLTNLKLEIKNNYQVFPVASRGVDFVGYRFYHTHTHLRKSIKKSMAKAAKRKNNKKSIAAYYGWAKHCDSRHLLKKLNVSL